jgi:hypothetical protein
MARCRPRSSGSRGRARWRETPVELPHSGAIARKDLSELTDEELMSMITSLAKDVGFKPPETIDATSELSALEAPALRLLRPADR